MKKTPDFGIALEDLIPTFTSPCKDRERIEANADLILILAKYLIDNPQIRFGQALRNLEIVRTIHEEGSFGPQWVNEFNTEPTEMLQRVKKALKEIS